MLSLYARFVFVMMILVAALSQVDHVLRLPPLASTMIFVAMVVAVALLVTSAVRRMS